MSQYQPSSTRLRGGLEGWREAFVIMARDDHTNVSQFSIQVMSMGISQKIMGISQKINILERIKPFKFNSSLVVACTPSGLAKQLVTLVVRNQNTSNQ